MRVVKKNCTLPSFTFQYEKINTRPPRTRRKSLSRVLHSNMKRLILQRNITVITRNACFTFQYEKINTPMVAVLVYAHLVFTFQYEKINTGK